MREPRENPDSSKLTHYDRSSGTDIKIDNNTKINDIMVSFNGHYNAISPDRVPLKTNIGKN